MSKPVVEILDGQTQHQPLLTGIPQTRGMRAGRVYLLAGEDCGRHSTEANEEMLIFLSGKGRAVIADDKSFDVGRDKIIYIPPRTIHNIINTSDEPLCYVYCVAPTNGNGEK